ncbi:MAG: FAD-binding oxidoreductase [Rhodospirillaceae bacterium]|nr:FAD-binding oxidoreductase [Rhodospirillaceae bacterium]
MRVVICGGGVIGAAIACFLARRGAEAVVVERTGLACAASGKAGGFLALDWCDGTPIEALARRSFALHAALAAELGGDWGWRRLATFGGIAGAPNRSGGGGLDWLSPAVTLTRRLGAPETTAQVHPAAFTAALMRAAEERGAELRPGRVTGLLRRPGRDRVAGVTVEDGTVEGDAVVIAMGPWSVLAARWLPLPPVFGLKGHSLVFETGDRVSADALFLEAREADGTAQSPEVFPRPDGTTYVCAVSSDAPLPADPAAVAPDPGAIERLQALCSALSPLLAGAPVLARQACYRPVTQDGLPFIGPVPGVEGAYVATGHGPWGILNAPATGEAMAELILDGVARTVDLAPFDPARLPPLDPRRLRVGTAG